MKRILAAVIMVFSLTACEKGGGNNFIPSANAGELPPPSFARHIIIGDSLMDAVFNAEEIFNVTHLSYENAAHLMQAEGKQVHNISRGGQMMVAADRLGVAGSVNYLASKDTAVIIELGHNDWVWGSGDLDSFVSDYKSFIDAITVDVEVFCIVPILVGHDITHQLSRFDESYDDLRDAIRGIAADGYCNVIETSDWYELNDLYNPAIFPDQLHLGPDGHKIYANRLSTALEDYLRLNPE